MVLPKDYLGRFIMDDALVPVLRKIKKNQPPIRVMNWGAPAKESRDQAGIAPHHQWRKPQHLPAQSRKSAQPALPLHIHVSAPERQRA
jgi:hypothetical protein